MTPLVKETEMKGIGPGERKCLYPNEADVIPLQDFAHLVKGMPALALNMSRRRTKRVLDLLSNYSQTGCEFQCKLQAALTMADHTLAGACIPWYYPAELGGGGEHGLRDCCSISLVP